MKQLLILRHAKSSWKHEGLDDHDRPLNKRGRRDAPRMGRWIRVQGLLPDAILSSTAVRAWTTALLVAEAAGFVGPIQPSRELYLGGTGPYLDALARCSDDHRRVMVVGHNPDLEDLLHEMTGRHEALGTAALSHVRLPIRGWKDVRRARRGELLGVWRPKELPAEFA